MYGPTPNIIIDKLESPPPEKIFKNPNKESEDNDCNNASLFTPGKGIAAKTLINKSMAITKNIFPRKTLSVKIIFNFFIVFEN